MAACMMTAEKEALKKDRHGEEEWIYTYGMGVYYVWSVFHKVPYGEIYPLTAAGKILSSFVCILGILY